MVWYSERRKHNFIEDGRGGGPRVVVSTTAFHAKVRGSFPGCGGLKENKMFLPHPLVKLSVVKSLRDRGKHARPQTARARIAMHDGVMGNL